MAELQPYDGEVLPLDGAPRPMAPYRGPVLPFDDDEAPAHGLAPYSGDVLPLDAADTTLEPAAMRAGRKVGNVLNWLRPGGAPPAQLEPVPQGEPVSGDPPGVPIPTAKPSPPGQEGSLPDIAAQLEGLAARRGGDPAPAALAVAATRRSTTDGSGLQAADRLPDLTQPPLAAIDLRREDPPEVSEIEGVPDRLPEPGPPGLGERARRGFMRSAIGTVGAYEEFRAENAARVLTAIDAEAREPGAELHVLDPRADQFLEQTREQYRAMPHEDRARMRAEAVGVVADGVARRIAADRKVQDIPAGYRTTQIIEAAKDFSPASISAAVSALIADPAGVIVDAATESTIPSLAMLAGAAVGGAWGGMRGAMLGAGSSSLVSSYVMGLTEALQDAGVDVTNEAAVRGALVDPELMSKVRNHRAAQSVPPSIFDALSIGLAGRVLAPARLPGGAREAVNVVAQTQAQGAMGAAGDVAGDLAVGKEPSAGKAVLSYAGEMGGAPMEVLGVRTASPAIQAEAPPGPATVERPASAAPDVPPASPSAPPASPAPAAPPAPSGFSGQAAIIPLRPIKSADAVTSTGRRVPVQYGVVEAANLVPSHTDDLTPNPAYPQQLQPRDRTRGATEMQITDLLNPEKFRPELLGESADAANGAPIVTPEGFPISGNMRSMALRRAYKRGLPAAEAYRAYLAQQGYPVDGMQAPVLVRIASETPEALQQIAVEANRPAQQAMSATEVAMTDARRIPDQMVALYRGGDIDTAGNREFVRAFVRDVVGQNERNSVVDDSGALSQDGLRRIRAALLAHAYGDPDLTASLVEQSDANFKAIGEGLVSAAPAWAKMRTARPELDATAAILEAVQLVRQARQKGQPVADQLGQSDMFDGGAKPEVAAAVRLFFGDDALRRPVSRQEVAGRLGWYAEQAMRNQPGPNLFGDAKPVTAADLLRLARDRGQSDILPDVAEARRPGDRELLDRPPGDSRRAADDARASDELPDTAAMQPGANYVGMRRDALNTAAPRRQEAIRRETILRDLANALDASLYIGRIKGDKILGFYRKRIEEIRSRKGGDLETTIHEAGHLLDDRYPEIRKQWTPGNAGNAQIRAELSGISYDRTKLFEGFAEFLRLWATQPTEAAARAPLFSKWWGTFLDNNPKISPALQNFRQQADEWYGQNPLDRARSKIGEPVDVNASLDSILDRGRQAAFDDLHGILRAERDLRGEPVAGGAYETSRLTRGKYALVQGALTLGAPKVQPDGSVRFVGKSLQDILRPVGRNLDDALLYFVGRSAHELQGQGRERLFTPREIIAMRQLETPERKRAFDEYQQWNKAILDLAQSKGIINPAFRAMWQRTQYLPFHRVGQPGAYEAVKGDWQGIKALTGGTENIQDVLTNMVSNARTLLDAAVTNDARSEIAKLAKEDGGARFLARIPTEDRAAKVPAFEVERAILDALGVKSKNALTPDQQIFLDQITNGFGPLVNFILRGQAPAGKNVFAVLKGGKPEYFEVIDPLLMRSVNALQRPVAGELVRLLALPKRLVHTTIVLDPSFMAANLARDTLMGSIMTRSGFRPLIDSARGLKSRLTDDPDYRDYIANGGGISSLFMEEGSMRQHLDAFYAKRGIDVATVMNTGRRLMHGLQQVGEAFELATRLGEYKRARARGDDPRRAAYLGREISTDFGMRGDSEILGFFFDTVPFFKAAMNGLDRYYRGLAHDPHRIRVAAWTGALAAASVGLFLINKDNELFQDLDDWDRDAHWHFYIPTIETLQARAAERPEPGIRSRYTHLRMPRIWEPGLVATLAERQLEGMLSGKYGDAAIKSAKAAARVMLPAGGTPIPAAVEPIMELAANRDFFRGSPIESEAMRDLAPWARSPVHGSSALRKVGEWQRNLPRALQVSPAKLEHIIRGYTNAWGAAGLSMLDMATDDAKPDMRLDEYPVLRRFYSQEPAKSTKHVREFYDMLRDVTEARRTVAHMKKTDRDDLAEEIEDLSGVPASRSRGAPRGAKDPFNAAAQSVRDVHREIDEVRRALTLPVVRKIAEERGLDAEAKKTNAWDRMGKLKRIVLDDMARERNELAKSWVTTLKPEMDAAKAAARQ